MASKAAATAVAAMMSTSFRSASRRNWLGYTKNKSRTAGMAYVSTDGSSTGWHSCVVAPADAPNTLLLRARHGDMQGTRNVGAEAAGYALGIETLPAGTRRATALADFLNALAFDCGCANARHPLLVATYARVAATKAANFPDGLALERIHHPGHQKDDSWFTQLNRAADHLSSLGEDVSCEVPVDALADLAKGVATCRARVATAMAADGSGAAAARAADDDR